MFVNTFESEFTWLNGFMRNVSRFGYKDAVIDAANGNRWTYEELNRDANKLANSLKSLGLAKNDLVFIQLYNSPQFLFNRKPCKLQPFPR
jgi:non-ribosomal peptide synthetase component E (peptide arylation enzyme)